MEFLMKYWLIPVALLVCLMALLLVPAMGFAEEGKMKVGLLFEREKMRNQNSKTNWFSTSPGLVLGYEKAYDELWWSVEGRYSYGRMNPSDSAGGTMDAARLKVNGIVGTQYDFDSILFKPFVGLGFNWDADDEIGGGNAYVTEYVMPIGFRAEKAFERGLLGFDFEFEPVLRREVYATGGGNTWGSRNFDGSYSVEGGIYYESVKCPIGFRPYYRFSKFQSTKYWDYIERNTFGLEAYMKF